MNVLTSNPTAARYVAHQLIAERVRDAEQRRVARELRDERRSAARAIGQRPARRTLPAWAFRLLGPAH